MFYLSLADRNAKRLMRFGAFLSDTCPLSSPDFSSGCEPFYEFHSYIITHKAEIWICFVLISLGLVRLDAAYTSGTGPRSVDIDRDEGGSTGVKETGRLQRIG
jgi:hypothetical protein